MKRIWLLLLVFIASCRGERSIVDLVALIPFAEAKPDTEVVLFAGTRAEILPASWSAPRKQSGGRFRYSVGDRPVLAWTRRLPQPAFLHLRVAATEPVPMQVHFGNHSLPVRLDPGSSVQTLSLPENTTRAEFKLPPAASFGLHSAIISPSRKVAEFRKPGPFPYVEKLPLRGKRRNGVLFETGGSVSLYETISPGTILEFGYYFAPSNALDSDSATFSVFLSRSRGAGKQVFERSVNRATYQTVRLPLGSYGVNSERVPVKLEFRISRDVAFGNGKTAWIEPRLYHSGIRPKQTTGKSAVHKFYKDANVMLIILDAASVSRFGSYGYHRDTTPEIDRFARDSVQFYSAYTNAVYTLASSATTLTGQLPIRHGVLQHRNRLPSAAITLPERLQSAGFDTAAFLANGNVSTAFGLTQGFATIKEVFRDRSYIGRAEDITGTFSDWLKSRSDRKFFAYLHYREPHDPYQPPLEWVQKFTDASYSGPVLRNFKERKPIEKNDPSLTAEDKTFISSLYDANLAYGDAQVGQVLRLLKKSGLYDRTFIIVTSDHGEAFWEHGYQGHNIQLYEESSRVPMFIKFPGGAYRGKKVRFPVQLADLYATLVELLGGSRRGITTDGDSFGSWLDQEGLAPERAIIVQTTRRFRNALIQGDYKFIDNGDQPDELYNLVKDPGEQANLIESEPIRAGLFRQVLLKKLAEHAPEQMKTEEAEIDDAARENLKALGYLD